MQKLSQILNQNDVAKKQSSFFNAFIQPKLTINHPNDIYEHEADAMADKVMRMKEPEEQQSFFSPFSNYLQRKCRQCEEEETQLHRKENSSGEVHANNDFENYVSGLNNSGSTLPQSAKQFFEPRFGTDFSNVRIHNNSIAAKSAASINALAYTSGSNIVFNEGQYAPGTESGDRLLAHELTHVVQQKENYFVQRAGNGVPGPIVVPVLTSPDVFFPCPNSVDSIVPEFIRESREHAVNQWKGEQVMNPTEAQIAKKAWLYLGIWRQTYPAADPRNPTDAELAIASAEHYSYARYLVASGQRLPLSVDMMIDGYTFLKDQLSHFGVEGILSADGNLPTKPTRCQNDWGHIGVIDGYADFLAGQKH